MHSSAADLFLHLLEKFKYFLGCPTKHFGKHTHAGCFKCREYVLQSWETLARLLRTMFSQDFSTHLLEQSPNFLLSLTFGPGSNGPFGMVDPNVGETALSENIVGTQYGIQFDSGLPCCSVHVFIPFLEVWTVPIDGCVIACERPVILLEFNPPSRAEVIPNFVYELIPIVDAHLDATGVDVIELVRIHPVTGHVVDKELYIGRHQLWLYG